MDPGQQLLAGRAEVKLDSGLRQVTDVGLGAVDPQDIRSPHAQGAHRRLSRAGQPEHQKGTVGQRRPGLQGRHGSACVSDRAGLGSAGTPANQGPEGPFSFT